MANSNNKQIKDLNIAVARLKPWARNPKSHPKEQIDLLVKSIKQYGFTVPILIDEDCRILAGHARHKAATQLEMETVPCRQITGATEHEKAALTVQDNKLAEMAEDDDRALQLIFAELNQAADQGEFDIDLSDLGFDVDEMMDAIGLGEPDDDEEDKADDENTPQRITYEVVITPELHANPNDICEQLRDEGWNAKVVQVTHSRQETKSKPKPKRKTNAKTKARGGRK